MKILRSALLYTGLILGANAALAGPMQDAIEGAKGTALNKLAVHSEPQAMPDVAFEGAGGQTTMAAYRGKVVVLNFWAVWCAPCREEMETLSALQAEFGGDEFEVVTVATGPNAPPAMDKFLDEIGVTNLPKHRDPRSAFARAAGVLGLPVTLVLDREGRELARLVGPADWHSDEARAMVGALIGVSG
ncbi:hypothetical protein ATO6_00165 [Oceanicola sp. 22II-s10i]|uniref:TlpA disulfide reductase family protein n=1 Tax=Oceanicola sp. 22II-s10i TaxID=1317116 RepID=UPI000B51E716|nr:TlpA disulfide reductase family protein [Oceanicola sp. 22II-s10i]OWU85414.1 hypothetical protein ATO6_00165 [Oceanicola sp. 22II-s10i]